MTTLPYEETTAERRDELELGQFIPLHYHFNMLADAARTGAFEEAIDLAVPEGGRVVELGGGTGVLSFFAARKAARVWCVERNPELADVARKLLRENGADAVEVVQADATAWLPPDPVDVVVCEMLHVGLLREKQIQVLSAFARGLPRPPRLAAAALPARGDRPGDPAGRAGLRLPRLLRADAALPGSARRAGADARARRAGRLPLVPLRERAVGADLLGGPARDRDGPAASTRCA